MRVLAVERKVIADERAAARTKRQVVAHLLVLHERLGDLERLEDRSQCGSPTARRLIVRAADR